MPRNENGSKLRRIANQKQWTQNGFLQSDDTREFHMPGKPRSRHCAENADKFHKSGLPTTTEENQCHGSDLFFLVVGLFDDVGSLPVRLTLLALSSQRDRRGRGGVRDCVDQEPAARRRTPGDCSVPAVLVEATVPRCDRVR